MLQLKDMPKFSNFSFIVFVIVVFYFNVCLRLHTKTFLPKLFDQCRRKHEICHAKCHCSIKASRTEGGRTDEQINLRVQQLNFASKKNEKK